MKRTHVLTLVAVGAPLLFLLLIQLSLTTLLVITAVMVVVFIWSVTRWPRSPKATWGNPQRVSRNPPQRYWNPDTSEIIDEFPGLVPQDPAQVVEQETIRTDTEVRYSAGLGLADGLRRALNPESDRP